jgi:hypothetical protein
MPVLVRRRHEMFARFTINALPALAAIDRGIEPDGDNTSQAPWGYLRDKDLGGTAAPSAGGQVEIVVSLKRRHRPDGREESRSPDDKA